MKIGIIVTESGAHSAEKLALACASNLVGFSNITPNDPRYVSATRLQLAIAEAITEHHVAVQQHTQASLMVDAAAHFARTDLHDPGDHLERAIAAIQCLTDQTEWAAQFRSEEGVAALRHGVGQSLVDTAHLERLYHHDRNPGDERAAAYRENPTGVLVLPASL